MHTLCYYLGGGNKLKIVLSLKPILFAIFRLYYQLGNTVSRAISLLAALYLISTTCQPWKNLFLSCREMGDWSLGAHFCTGNWQWPVWFGASWLLAQQGQGSHQNHSRRGYVGRGLHRGGWSHDVSGQNKSTQRCLWDDVLCCVLWIPFCRHVKPLRCSNLVMVSNGMETKIKLLTMDYTACHSLSLSIAQSHLLPISALVHDVPATLATICPRTHPLTLHHPSGHFCFA